MIDKIKLSRCPFCGSKNIEIVVSKTELAYVICRDCWAMGSYAKGYRGYSAAYYAAGWWNTRYRRKWKRYHRGRVRNISLPLTSYSQPGSFMRAQGIVPWREGDELPEETIRRYRDGKRFENWRRERDEARALDSIAKTIVDLARERDEARRLARKYYRWMKSITDGYHSDGYDHITDGLGNWWPARCPNCGGEMQIMRPGYARCENECES